MMTGLLHVHSSFRYLVLLFIVLTIIDAVIAISRDKSYARSSKMFALLALIFSHTQLLVGLLLYFLGDKGFKVIVSVEGFMGLATARFFAIEHIAGMIIAVTLITIGYSKSKKQVEDKKRYSTILTYYAIALAIIFVMIPWPFLKDFGTWI